MSKRGNGKKAAPGPLIYQMAASAPLKRSAGRTVPGSAMQAAGGASRQARLLERVSSLADGDAAAAQDWLNSPLSIFGGETPLEHARTDTGAREVEEVIGRLESGVYS